MSQRIAFNPVDTLIFDVDRTRDPWSVHCEVRVTGRLDAERLAAAATAALRRHPMARARMEPFGGSTRRFQWLIDDGYTAVPLVIAESADDTAAEALRSQLLSRRVDLHVAPPLSLGLAHHPGGDYLIMNLSHVVGDGMSGYRLMTSICRAYAGVADPVPDLPLDLVRNLRAHVGSRTIKDATTRFKGVKGLISDTRGPGKPVRVAIDGGIDKAQGYGFQLLRLGQRETAQVMARRKKPATVNDLLLAGLALAVRRFNDRHDVTPGRVSFMMPVNLRPAEWSRELVSNIVSFVPVAVSAEHQSDLGTAQKAVGVRTAELKEQRQSGTMVDILGMTSIWPAGVRHAAIRLSRGAVVDPILDTAVLSNLGNIPEPLDFGADAGVATELWFSPPASMPLGTAVGAATMNDEMFLTIRYCNAQYDKAGAAAFADTYRRVLLDD